MKKILRWRVLFGFLVIFTILIASLILYDISRERNRIHSIVGELIRMAKNVDSTNHVTTVIVDSLVNHLSYLSSQVTLLESQKDSLIKAKGYPKREPIKASPGARSGNSTELKRPVFSVTDKRGKVIGTDGIAIDSLEGIKVIAGTGFLVTGIDVSLARGTSGVMHTRFYGTYDFGGLSGYAVVGDRIVIEILRVSRVNDRGPGEKVDIGTVILTVPIRSSYKPYFYVADDSGQKIESEGINQTEAMKLKSLRVSAGSGYQITNMIITVQRGNSTIIEKVFNNGFPMID